MAWFNGWPFTNFQEQNLDWLIREFRKQGLKLEELEQYVNELKQNVSQEVADIIQEMYDDGTLANIIDTYVQGKVSYYNIFSDIPTSGLVSGDIVITAGFYAIGDGGGAVYIVRPINTYTLDNGVYSFQIIGVADPKMAGAHADGATDDFAIIQGLINDYKRIWFGASPRNYLIDGTLTIPSNRTLEGEMCTITRADNRPAPDTNVVLLSSSNTNHVTVRGLQFQGGTQSVLAMTLSFETVQDLVVEHCYIRDTYGYGIRFYACNNALIDNLKFINATGGTGNPGGGMYIHGGSMLFINDCYGSNLMDHLVYLDGSSTITNVSVKGCVTRLTNSAMALTGAASIVVYGDVKRLSISNCNFYTPKDGISIEERNGYTPSGVSITGCNIYDADQQGIVIKAASGNIPSKIQNINIVGCSVVNAGQDAIDIRTGNGINIVGCNIDHAARYGVSMSNANNVMVSSCMIEDVADGVLVGRNGEACTNVVIANNNIGEASAYGIMNQKGSNVKIDGNIFFGTFGTKQILNSDSALAVSQGVTDDTARSIYWNSAQPASGKFNTGDICFDSTGATGGWRCTSGGTPGTWTAL